MNGARYCEIPSPARTDGIAGALRRAFHPVAGAAEDFDHLLRELDRKRPS